MLQRLQELSRFVRISVSDSHGGAARSIGEDTRLKLSRVGFSRVSRSFSVNLVVKTDDIKFKDESKMSVYEDKNTDSGHTAIRKFCGNCGS